MALSAMPFSSTGLEDITVNYHPPVFAPSLPPQDDTQEEMYQKFQSWALRNYGDSGKTKTVTRRKYNRIVRILTGEEPATTENSKFRFWVKGKAFRLGPATPTGEYRILYVPTKASMHEEESDRNYKRVAIVEDFFRIIYSVHVVMDGRGGKHAGQKRTYRAIAETYSFLPREAVTRFLMSCNDCQKRMHLTMETNNNSQSGEPLEMDPIRDDPPIMDFDLPITTAYLQHVRSKEAARNRPIPPIQYPDEDDDSMSSSSSQLSTQSSPSPAPENRISPRPMLLKHEATGVLAKMNGAGSPINLHKEGAGVKREGTSPDETTTASEVINMTERNGTTMLLTEPDDIKPLNMSSAIRPEVKVHNDRKRRLSSDSMDSLQTKASESAADDASKDDEDENDDDDDEKMSTTTERDPERLKAFNMFVRLFVDENLDRVVPISKQPKDKIQAILDACDRQFAEFHERSRKRIRTYLKSCRRMRRSKDSNGWDQLRPTPPHLTSAAAEGILAHACENESQNAKRMRMGLDPLPPTSSTRTSPTPASLISTHAPIQSLSPPQAPSMDKQPQSASEFPRHTPSAPTAFRPPHEMPSPFFASTNDIFRPGFPTSYQSPAHHHNPIVPHAQITSQIQNGPTDLSMKKSSLTSSSSKSQLNSTEVSTIKQLIAGYRESAAFLYRSADELEQLLLHQN